MLDIVTKSGKRIGRISDSSDCDDTIVVNGKEIALTDAYANDDVKELFNKNLRELKSKKIEDAN